MARIADSLTEPQTARAKMRAGSGFEAEASVTVTPVGLLAVGGLMAAILLSSAAIVRAARRRPGRVGTAEPQRLTQDGRPGAPPALPAPSP
jgi:hypothetical protein